MADPIDEAVWAVSRDASLTFRGFGPGSLFDVLIGLHADGWRLFASGAEQQAFLLKEQFDASAFDAAARNVVGEALPRFSAAALRATLAARPRKAGTDTIPALLAERLARGLGANAAGINHPPQLIVDLADALAASFPTWQGLSMVDSRVGEVIDAVLAQHGARLPSLALGWAAALPSAVKEIGVPTLAFDAGAPTVAETSLAPRFAAVVARYLRESSPIEEAGTIKAVQSLITTSHGNALSWLFGVGLRAFRECPTQALATALGLKDPRAVAALDILAARMKALPLFEALGDRAYSDARFSLQGTVDSLIANYLGRLHELSRIAEHVSGAHVDSPALLANAEVLRATLQGMPFNADDIADLYREQVAQYEHVLAALDVLCGRRAPGAAGFAPILAAVDAFGAWVDRFHGIVGQINERLRQLGQAELSLVAPLSDEGRWKSLVSFNAPEAPPAERIEELEAELQLVLDAGRAAYEHLVRTYRPTFDSAIETSRQEVHRAIDFALRRGRVIDAAADTGLLARRKLLDPIARLARRSSKDLANAFLAEVAAQGLTKAGTATERSLRGHVLSGQQVMYAHPMGQRRSVVRLERDGLARLDFGRLLSALHANAAMRKDAREQVLLRFVEEAILLSGLPERIAIEDVRWIAPEEAPWADLRASGGTVARSEVIKAFVAPFHNQASGLLYRLSRSRFTERHELRCFAGPTALFVPKAGSWSPPAQYRTGKYAALFADPELPWMILNESVDTVRTARWLAKRAAAAASGPEHAAIVSLLSQLPHEWAVACDFAGAQVFEGVHPSNGTVSNWVKRKGYRLELPRHFAGALLEAFKGVSLSPHALMFERVLERRDGAVVELERRVYASIPIGSEVHATDPWVPRHLVGLDLGEAGLGICLKHLTTGAETPAFLKTKRLRLLARRHEHYRKRVQLRQAFRKTRNESLGFAIKAAIGEICGVIDNLIVRYDAVPVFESRIASARGSNRMVGNVYAGVLQRYAFVGKGLAAQAVRQTHWHGAARFQYSYGVDLVPAARQLNPKSLSRAKAESVFRPSMGAPGVLVSGYRTSLICSCCQQDVLGLIDAAIAAGQTGFTTDAGGVGELALPGGPLKLQLEAPSPNVTTQREARRHNRRTPFEVVRGRTFSLVSKADQGEFAMMVRRAMRRPASDIATHGSSQWEFHCPLLACGQRLQADVNAATNIVRRYSERVSERTAISQNWADPAIRATFAAKVAAGLDDDADEPAAT